MVNRPESGTWIDFKKRKRRPNMYPFSQDLQLDDEVFKETMFIYLKNSWIHHALHLQKAI